MSEHREQRALFIQFAAAPREHVHRGGCCVMLMCSPGFQQDQARQSRTRDWAGDGAKILARQRNHAIQTRVIQDGGRSHPLAN
jgi:hypothetical protein